MHHRNIEDQRNQSYRELRKINGAFSHVKTSESRNHELPTIDVQTLYAGESRSASSLSLCNAFLTKLTTKEPLRFESSGQKHNFNFQISQGVCTEWKSGTRVGIDVVAPGHVSLNAAQEHFKCSVAPVSEAVSLHVEMNTSWIKEIRERETKNGGGASGELLPMMAVWHKNLSKLSMDIAIAISRPDTACVLQVEQLLIELAVELICRANPSSIELQPRGKLPTLSLKRVIDYINDQLSVSHSLETLAATAGFSSFHFARLFKTTVGLSPHQYLTRLRIHRSQLLLAHGSLPITSIATELGFDSSSHFAATFRQVTGWTPSSFRAAHS
jgi:AraC-like DNA-binding protein